MMMKTKNPATTKLYDKTQKKKKINKKEDEKDH